LACNALKSFRAIATCALSVSISAQAVTAPTADVGTGVAVTVTVGAGSGVAVTVTVGAGSGVAVTVTVGAGVVEGEPLRDKKVIGVLTMSSVPPYEGEPETFKTTFAPLKSLPVQT